MKHKGRLLTVFCIVTRLFISRGQMNVSHMPKIMLSFSTELIYRAWTTAFSTHKHWWCPQHEPTCLMQAAGKQQADNECF